MGISTQACSGVVRLFGRLWRGMCGVVCGAALNDRERVNGFGPKSQTVGKRGIHLLRGMFSEGIFNR